MPEAQYGEMSGRDLLAHLVVADGDPADLARLIGCQLLADPRISDQPIRCVGELLDHARRHFGGDRTQMLVQSHKVRRRLAGPLDLHLTGEGSGLSVPRLSAHAVIAWWSITRPASTSSRASRVIRRRSHRSTERRVRKERGERVR